MRVQILGSAAGGGLPQWNCRCPNCEAARNANGSVTPRTQSSVAISADGDHWFLLNVSADVRVQINARRNLWPPSEQLRGTAVAGCLLTDAEIDHASGLLQLREGCRFTVYSTALVRRWLTEDLPIARILAPFATRDWIELTRDQPEDLKLPSGARSGLSVQLLNVGADVPRYVREPPAELQGSIVGFLVTDQQTGSALIYAPGVSTLSDELKDAAASSRAVLLDGTFWTEDEPRKMGISEKTAFEMGHIPVAGDSGSFAWLSRLSAPHRVYIHINNTNPMLNETGSEHQLLARHGVLVGQDGDTFEL